MSNNLYIQKKITYKIQKTQKQNETLIPLVLNTYTENHLPGDGMTKFCLDITTREGHA